MPDIDLADAPPPGPLRKWFVIGMTGAIVIAGAAAYCAGGW